MNLLMCPDRMKYMSTVVEIKKNGIKNLKISLQLIPYFMINHHTNRQILSLWYHT